MAAKKPLNITDGSRSVPMPVHRHREPARDTASVIPARAPSGTDAARAAPLPVTAAQMQEKPVKMQKIQLMIITIPPAGFYEPKKWK